MKMTGIKKLVCAAVLVCTGLFSMGFKAEDFDPDDLKHYRKEFVSESIGACSSSSVKTYEDYRMITATGSAQYQYIHKQKALYAKKQAILKMIYMEYQS